MTILEWILLILGIIIVVPILAFLSVKSGTAGFYRGKEVGTRNAINTDSKEETEKTENFD